MEDEITKLTDSVAELLSDDNKDKSLGEVSEDLNNYLIDIKELVESNQISYESLKSEIKKHINLKNGLKPGSVGQLLIGCMESSECAMSKETAEDIAFAYDNKNGVIVPLTKLESPISEKSYCVLYINGNPDEINTSLLRNLENAGFKKIKIKHKNTNETEYKTFNIENIQKYISSSEKGSGNGKMILGCILILIILYFVSRQKIKTS